MSVELDLVCRDCREAIWGGCDGFSGHQFLSGNQLEMRAIGEFLYKHMGHQLAYEPEHLHEEYEQVGGLCSAVTVPGC